MFVMSRLFLLSKTASETNASIILTSDFNSNWDKFKNNNQHWNSMTYHEPKPGASLHFSRCVLLNFNAFTPSMLTNLTGVKVGQKVGDANAGDGFHQSLLPA